MTACAVQRSLFDQRDLAEVSCELFLDEHLIFCYSPPFADQRRRKLQELLVATEEKLETIDEATQRSKRALRREDTIGLRRGREMHRNKMAKHFVTENSETSFDFRRNSQTLLAEQALDRIYIDRTNLEPEWFSADETVRVYKDHFKGEQVSAV